MKPIGGFLELEQSLGDPREIHPGALRLSYGRTALRLALELLRPKLVLVPFYSCAVVIETVNRLQIPYRFYDLNHNLESVRPLDLNDDECAIVINYFGLKHPYVSQTVGRFGNRIIVDNTQAFFEGASGEAFSFNSARKFFGVPDGSYLYGSPQPIPALKENSDISILHLIKRAEGDLKTGYQAFLDYEGRINSELRGISSYSQGVLSRIDYAPLRERRRKNFQMYHDVLGLKNTFPCNLIGDAVPLCYPFVPGDEIDRTALRDANIFIPTFWPEVNQSAKAGFSFEKNFAQRLMPLPLDQRYGVEDVQAVIRAITELLPK